MGQTPVRDGKMPVLEGSQSETTPVDGIGRLRNAFGPIGICQRGLYGSGTLRSGGDFALW